MFGDIADTQLPGPPSTQGQVKVAYTSTAEPLSHVLCLEKFSNVSNSECPVVWSAVKCAIILPFGKSTPSISVCSV